MQTGLPNDPVMLLSVVNTKLRDYYRDLDTLCEDLRVERGVLEKRLESIDYIYDKGRNQFV